MNTRASGLAALTYRLESASESAGSAALAGAGRTGVSTGIITIQFITTIATTPEAERSTTGTPSTDELRLRVVAFVQERRGGLSQPRVGRAPSSIVLAEQRGRSREAPPLPEATLRLVGKVESIQALSATTIMAERREPIHRAGAPALVPERAAAVEGMAAEGMAAGATDPGSLD